MSEHRPYAVVWRCEVCADEWHEDTAYAVLVAHEARCSPVARHCVRLVRVPMQVIE